MNHFGLYLEALYKIMAEKDKVPNQNHLDHLLKRLIDAYLSAKAPKKSSMRRLHPDVTLKTGKTETI